MPYGSRRLLRGLFGVLLVGWLFLGVIPVATTTGLTWQIPQASAAQVLYVNDAAGRLAAVIDPNTNAAVYHYDVVGNILSVSQYPATQVSIIAVNPNSSDGTQAQVCGTGFSSTLSQNTVSFNGVTGTVLSVSGACLTVLVPSNATTGTVALTTPTGSATSGVPYVITPVPTISSFTPALGDAGNIVTVSGSALGTDPARTTVGVGNIIAALNSLTNSQVVFAIPSNAASGPIQVTTPYGQATSATDLIVPPSAIGAANVVSSALLTVNGGAQPLNVNASNKYGIFVFNATAGQALTVQLSAVATTLSGGSVRYQVFSPTNIQIDSGSVSASWSSIVLPIIPATGTYLVAFASDNGTVQLSGTLQTDATLTTDGAALSVVTTATAHYMRFTFAASAGQSLGLAISDLTFSPTTATWASAYVYEPDPKYGGGLAFSYCYPTPIGCHFNLSNLPKTGIYSVLVSPGVSPDGTASMNFNATLTSDITGNMNINTPVNLNLARPGQEGLVSFIASAGQNIALAIDSVITTPANTNVTVLVYAPDGSTLASVRTANSTVLNLSIPSSGTYEIGVVPDDVATASLSLRLSNPVTSTLNIDGTPTSLALSSPGQGAQATFSGTAGQNLNLAVVATTSTNANIVGDAMIFSPNGVMVAGAHIIGSQNINLPTFPANGGYTVRFQQTNTSVGTVTLTLSSAVTGMLTINGAPTTLNLARSGQSGQATFSGIAGQYLTLEADYFGLAGSLTVIAPDGRTVPGRSDYPSGSINLTLNALPMSGTYTVRFQQTYPLTGALKLTLSNPVTGTVNINGASTTLSMSVHGQGIRATFNGTAGQVLNLAVVADRQGYVSILNPDGSNLWTDFYLSWYHATLSTPVLPVTGTYTVLFRQRAATSQYDVNTGNITLTLTTRVTGTLTLNAASSTVNLSKPGQGALVTFFGTQGQQYLSLGIQSPLISNGLNSWPLVGYPWIVIYPDGTGIWGYDPNLPILPQTGTYQIILDPSQTQPPSTGSVALELSSPLMAGALNVNGAPTAFSLVRFGETAEVTFSGAPGQQLSVSVSGVTSASRVMRGAVTVLSPNGSTLVSTTGFVDLANITLSLPVLSTSGTYTVLVQQQDMAGTGTVTISLSSPQDGDLNGDGVVDIADLALAKRMALGIVMPTVTQFLHGDVAPAGGNGTIDIADVARIRRKALGVENF